MPPIWIDENDQFVAKIMGQFADDGVARRMVAAVKERIHSGAYRPGDRLPSTRAFAAEWGASRTTVTAAYGQLISEGYLVTRQGARATVAEGLLAPPTRGDPKRDHPRTLSAFGRRLLELPPPAPTLDHPVADFRYGDLAASDFPVLAWQRAMKAAVLRREPRLRYADPLGSTALRTALRGYLWRARGIACTPDDIIVVNGSQQGLDLCARLLLDPGDPFVMENPGYILARHAFLAAGGTAIPAVVDTEGVTTDGLPPARLAYVTPSHQYPLGSVLSASRRRALVSWAERVGAVIIEDDYDGEYRHDVAPIPPLQTLEPDLVIYVGTVSKTLSPTLRLGYLVVPPALRVAFAEAKRLTDRHTPLLEQEALAAFLEDGTYERHVRAVRRKNAERRGALLAALSAAFGPVVRVEGAETGLHLVAWFDGMPAGEEPALAAAARKAGVGLHPVGPLYDPTRIRPASAGFVMGYAGLGTDAVARGVSALVKVIGRGGSGHFRP